MLGFTLSSLLYGSQTFDDHDIDENCSRTNPHQIEDQCCCKVSDFCKNRGIIKLKKTIGRNLKNKMVTKN